VVVAGLQTASNLAALGVDARPCDDVRSGLCTLVLSKGEHMLEEMPSGNTDPTAWVVETIARSCGSAQNSLGMPEDEPAFGAPLVGFAAGDDPLFEEFKQHIGASHWTPGEAFALAFPELTASAAELTVISWILPHTEQTKRDNRRETRLPAERWARAKFVGEQFNVALREHLVAALAEAGIAAVAPTRMPEWTKEETTSIWSERHMAYAAGLGTFGLCDGLITPLGKAMRCGSIVARLALAPTPRAYSDHHAYCDFFTEKGCAVCAGRCPVGAISERGHDKARCLAYLARVRRGFIEPHFGFSTDVCGLCQTDVPCESTIPGARQTLR
jgi:epoxyqueuosine reductase